MSIYNLDGTPITAFTQWDSYRQIIIDGNFSEAAYVDFYNEEQKNSLRMRSTLLDTKQLQVELPNALLLKNYPIEIYVYIHEGDGGKTILYTRVPVIPKPEPYDFDFKDNVEVINLLDLKKELEDAEAIRNSNENQRISNETERINNENVRIENENIRINNENQRIAHENERVTNEKNRVSAESNRASEYADLTQKCKDATDASKTATSESKEATANAITAKDNAVAATNSANASAERCENAITELTKINKDAVAATNSANVAASEASKNSTAANTAAERANNAAQIAEDSSSRYVEFLGVVSDELTQSDVDNIFK